MDQTTQKIRVSFSRFMVKADRVAAWTMLIVVLMFAVSGFGMTKGLIDRDLARTLHFSWLAGIGLAAFVVHTSWAVRLSLMRWRVWNLASKIGLFAAYAVIVLGLGYLYFFYQPSWNEAVLSDEISAYADDDSPAETAAPTAGSASEAAQTVFTAETLAVFDGLGGQPAYAAIDGKVYDLSSVFRNGAHEGFSAGKDWTAEFHSQHPASLLKNFSVVGTYQK